jgi:hypothetical protein
MPIDYDVKAKQFVSEGRKVSRLEVRNEINGLLQFVEQQAASLGKRFNGGEVSRANFENSMRELLRSAHIIAASVGKGGRSQMTQADWGRIGAKIKWQYGYLDKFAKKLDWGILSESAAAARAKSYASSIFVSFSNNFQEAQTEFVAGGKNPLQARLIQNSEEGCAECTADAAEGWMSVDDMGEIGSRLCGDFCKCDIEFSDDLNAEDLKFNVKISIE